MCVSKPIAVLSAGCVMLLSVAALARTGQRSITNAIAGLIIVPLERPVISLISSIVMSMDRGGFSKKYPC